MLDRTTTFVSDGAAGRLTARYGFDEDFARRTGQLPYFSLTGTVWRKAGNSRWVWESGGCQHDVIGRRLRSLRPFIKWHLVDCAGTPMHYIANGEYWAYGYKQHERRPGDPDPVEAFKSTVVFGALTDDRLPDLSNPLKVRDWLVSRLPALRPAMLRDMEAAGIQVPDPATFAKKTA